MKPISIIVFTAVFASCTARLYSGKNKFEIGRIDNRTLNSLKSYLFKATNRVATDTIIIKFDFNKETCWDSFDLNPDSVIMKNVVHYQNYIRSIPVQRPNASVYMFREPGSRFNKIKSFNKDILIDDGFLQQLFFKKRTICGSSVIVDPAGNYLITKSDSHFEAHTMSKEQFESFFK